MKALLQGCRLRGVRPNIITTSVYETSGIDLMVRSLVDDLVATGTTMYFIANGLGSMNRCEQPCLTLDRSADEYTASRWYERAECSGLTLLGLA